MKSYIVEKGKGFDSLHLREDEVPKPGEAFDYEALKKKTWSNFAWAKIYSAKEAPLLRY